MKISVIIPAYNEEKTIENTVFTIDKFLYNNFSNYEIIVVNDGSSDKTRHILSNIFLNITVINFNQNHGKGYAIKEGIKYATGDYIIFTDADGAYDVKNIKSIVKGLEKNDIAIGVRDDKKENYNLKRKMYSNAFKSLSNVFLKENLDTQCGIKGFRKTSAKRLFSLVKTNGFAFDFEVIYLAKKLDFSIDKINVIMNKQQKSSINFVKDPIVMALDIVKVDLFYKAGEYNKIISKETIL